MRLDEVGPMQMETRTPQQTPGHAGPSRPARDAALRRLGRLKATVTVASVLGFAALSGVIARQASGTTSAPSSSLGNATKAAPSAPSNTGPGPENGQAPAPQGQGTGSQGQQGLQGQDPAQGTQGPQGGFFSQGQGGYGFGNGNSAQGQGSVAGSGVS